MSRLSREKSLMWPSLATPRRWAVNGILFTGETVGNYFFKVGDRICLKSMKGKIVSRLEGGIPDLACWPKKSKTFVGQISAGGGFLFVWKT